MKICVMSDLHLEFEGNSRDGILGGMPAVKTDLGILAGDIHTKARAPEWAARSFPGIPVVMLGGNHEPYNASLYADIDRNRKEAAAQGSLPDGTQHVSWLERETFTWTSPAGERIRVIGATLWTDFKLYGDSEQLMAEIVARRDMNDFSIISVLEDGETRRFDPEDAERIHALSVAFIRDELAEPFDGLSVVATHHAPSILSVPAQYREDLLSAAFASDLEDIIAEFQPPLWIHGHTHASFDYRIGNTRILCNPRGYWRNDLNPDFVWGKTVELSYEPGRSLRVVDTPQSACGQESTPRN